MCIDNCIRMCDFFQFVVLFTVYDRKSLLGILLAAAQIPEYFNLTVQEVHTFANFMHIDVTSYGNIIKRFEKERDCIPIDTFLQFLCDEIPLQMIDIISIQLQENLLGVNTYRNIKERQKKIEYIMKYKEQHNNENPSESLGVRIRHYFTGEPSQYQYDYVPSATDTYTSILQYYRDQYNIPRPKELPPLYAHNNNNNKASNRLLSDLSSHSRSDYNEDQISLIKKAYGNRTAEIPACFRSSSRSKYSVSASSHSERRSSEDEEEEDDEEDSSTINNNSNHKHVNNNNKSNNNNNNENNNEDEDDGMSLIQMHRKSSHSSSISANLHPKTYYKNSVEKTCWINVNPVVVKPFSQVNNEDYDDK